MNKLISAAFAFVLLASTIPGVSYAKNNNKGSGVVFSASAFGKVTAPGQLKKIEIENDEDEDNNESSCPTKAFGHLIAPGWIKNKNSGERPALDDDCNLPHGIWKKHHDHDDDDDKPRPTSTDKIAPVISTVSTSAVTTSSATITWTTNEPATSRVAYGTSTNYTHLSVFNNAKVTSHSVTITGLSASTTYHFSVRSRDGSNNLATSTNYTFTTPALPDTTAPIISLLATTSTTASSTTVTWSTNENATSKVYYSIFSPVDTNASSTLSFGTTTLTMQHSTTLLGLSASTTYYLLIESRDASNNTGTTTTTVTTLQ